MKTMKSLHRLVLALSLCTAATASASVVTYDVDANFDPAGPELGPGIGTITGTVSIDTAAPNPTAAVTAIDLTENTNSSATIGGGFGSPTFNSYTFDQTGTFDVIFFGSPITYSFATATVGPAPAGNPPGDDITLFVQTNEAILDGTPVGPAFTLVFPTDGGAVVPGNFDSITSETRYLFGTVAVAPEPSTWTLLGLGVFAVGTATRCRRRTA